MRAGAVVAALIILAAGMVSTAIRNRTWINQTVLWTDTVKKSPRKERAVFNRARAFHKEGHLKQAVNLYLKAIQRFPENPDLLNNLGNVYSELHQYGRAIPYYRLALDRLNAPRTHFNLAFALEMTGDIKQSIHHYNEAATLDPGDLEAKSRREMLLELYQDREP